MTPPEFLQLIGHPIRWELLTHLSRSDRQVRELTVAIGQPQNLVSYHLGLLREKSLVKMRRSSADRRDAYYSVDLDHCGEMLITTGGALHPALRLQKPSNPYARARILFLCTGNSARSQMAEAMLRDLTQGKIETRSAGSTPKPVHPLAVETMRERGIDISSTKSKHLDRFLGKRFDHVVTLCDRLREVCPQFSGSPNLIHWSMPDPSLEKDVQAAFRRTADELTIRISYLRLDTRLAVTETVTA